MMFPLGRFSFDVFRLGFARAKKTKEDVIEVGTLMGFETTLNRTLGLLSVCHDGSITWDELQQLKNAAFGEEARAIEVYPAQSQLVNARSMRHLWRLGEHDFCPDLLGDDTGKDSLLARHSVAWAEARD